MKLYAGALSALIYISFLSVFTTQAPAKNVAKARLYDMHSEIHELKDTKNFLTYCIKGLENGVLLRVKTGPGEQDYMFVSKPMVTQSLALAVNSRKMTKEDAAEILAQYTDDSSDALPGLKKLLGDLELEMKFKRDKIYALRSRLKPSRSARSSEEKVPRAVIKPEPEKNRLRSRQTPASGTRTPHGTNTAARTNEYGGEIDAEGVSRKDVKTPGVSSPQKSLDITTPPYPGIPSDFVTRSGPESFNTQSGSLSENDMLKPQNIRGTNLGYAKVEITTATIGGTPSHTTQDKEPLGGFQTKTIIPSLERDVVPDASTLTKGFRSPRHDSDPKPSPIEIKSLRKDMLGKVWTQTQSGFSGTWVRKGASNEFYAVWELGSHRVEAALQVETHGERNITVFKKHGTDGVDCIYKGTFSEDGRAVSGTYTCPGEAYNEHWEAHIWN